VGEQSYGGIRASAFARGAAGWSGAARLGAPGNNAGTGNGVRGNPGGSPMATMPNRGARALAPDVSTVLVILVLAEMLALVALRGAFRHNHGG
jgi:hypothetical protein